MFSRSFNIDFFSGNWLDLSFEDTVDSHINHLVCLCLDLSNNTVAGTRSQSQFYFVLQSATDIMLMTVPLCLARLSISFHRLS